MHAVILLAGYGSRLNRADLPHKSLLPVGDETLLSRHLKILDSLEIAQIHLVVGHNKEAVKDYVRGLGITTPVKFVDNDAYRTTGNTLSLVMGLRQAQGPVLVMDADVLYPRAVLKDYVQTTRPSSFAVVAVDADDAEASKVLLDDTGRIHSFVTKRLLTAEEQSLYTIAGEAIGFFLLDPAAVGHLLAAYDRNEAQYRLTLWEIPFSDIAPQVEMKPYYIDHTGCIEIDTQQDYEAALRLLEQHPQDY